MTPRAVAYTNVTEDDWVMAETLHSDPEMEARCDGKCARDECVCPEGGWEAEAERLRAELAEKQASFDLRWKADMRAIEMWHVAGNDELTWPDHADLVVWLMGEVERAEGWRIECGDANRRESEARRALAAAHSALHSGEPCGSMHDDIEKVLG